MSVTGIVRSPVRQPRGTPVPPTPGESDWSFPSIPAGNSPTLGVDAPLTVPTGHDAIHVRVGDTSPGSPPNDVWVILYVNRNGTTRPYRLTPYSGVILPAAPGDQFAFMWRKRRCGSATEVTPGPPPVVAMTTGQRPPVFAGPTTTPQTVPVDVAAIPIWTPSVANLTTPTHHARITIESASYPRVVYESEQDDSGNWSPPRAIVIPAGETRTIYTRYRRVAFASVGPAFGEADTLSLRLPDGTTIGSRVVYEPSFGVIRTVNVSTASALRSALLSAQDGDDIVLADGTYDMTSASDRISVANYGTTALSRSIRIRSASEDRNACIIRGAMQITLSASDRRWVMQSLTLDVDGQPVIGNGAIETKGGEFIGVDLVLRGAPTGGNVKTYSAFHSSYPTIHYLIGCHIRDAVDDAVDASNAPNSRLRCVGCLVDGNGGDANDQLVTAHGESVVEMWNCRFTDASRSGNQPRITADSISHIYLMYCVQPTGLVADSNGMTVHSLRGMLGCVQPEVQTLSLREGYCAYSIVSQRTTSAVNLLPLNANGVDGRWRGACVMLASRFTAANVSGANCCIVQSNASYAQNTTAIACVFRSTHSSNSIPIRFTDASNPPNGVFTLDQCRLIAAGTSNVFRLDNVPIVVIIRNTIFSGSTTYTINASGSTANVCTGSIHQGSKPTNWDTRFGGGQTATVFGATPSLASDESPTAGGNCDETGLDLGYYGAIDANGKTLSLSTSPQRGPVARAYEPASAIAITGVW